MVFVFLFFLEKLFGKSFSQPLFKSCGAERLCSFKLVGTVEDACPYNLYVRFAGTDHGTLFVSARCTPSVAFAASSRPQGPVNTVAQRGVYGMESRKGPKNAVILHKIAQAKLCNPTKLQISEKTFKKAVRFWPKNRL